MERYDAVIIGAGPDGLIAAHKLASAGLNIVVVERREATGGCALTRTFHPGFAASPFGDELAPIPASLFHRIDLPRHGGILMPTSASSCLSAHGTTVIYRDEVRMARVAGRSGTALVKLCREVKRVRAAIARRAGSVSPNAGAGPSGRNIARRPWPGEAWAGSSLAEALDASLTDSNVSLHLAAHVLSGNADCPYRMGTALHLLRGLEASGLPRGGLVTLARALDRAARAAGAIIRVNAEVSGILVRRGTAAAVVLSGGEEISGRAVISTLDLKRTFLDLVAWNELPQIFAKRVSQFRMAGATARVLFALEALPEFEFANNAHETAPGPVHVVDSFAFLSEVHGKWRAGILAEKLPVTLRVPSLTDPSLAPEGGAVMTATLGGVPATLLKGEWNTQTRGKLVKTALLAAERAAPGLAARVVGAKTIIGKDAADELGWTAGDFEGGELAPDQALGFRPFAQWQEGRTAIRGLYLGGPSAAPSPFFLGAGGDQAGASLFADIKNRHLK